MICEKCGGEKQSFKSRFFDIEYSICTFCDDKSEDDEKENGEEGKKYESMIKAFIPERFQTCQLSNWEGEESIKSRIKLFVENVKNGKEDNLILYGTVGTGKTHLALSVYKYLLWNNIKSGKNKRIEYRKIYKLFRDIKDCWSVNKSEKIEIDILSNITCLIIDEIGVQFGSKTEENFLFEILNERYEKKLPTMLLSNLDEKGLSEYLGHRVIDRLMSAGQMIKLEGKSRR